MRRDRPNKVRPFVIDPFFIWLVHLDLQSRFWGHYLAVQWFLPVQSFPEGWPWCIKMYLYFRIPSVKHKLPTPDVPLQPKTCTNSPPCLTNGCRTDTTAFFLLLWCIYILQGRRWTDEGWRLAHSSFLLNISFYCLQALNRNRSHTCSLVFPLCHTLLTLVYRSKCLRVSLFSFRCSWAPLLAIAPAASPAAHLRTQSHLSFFGICQQDSHTSGRCNTPNHRHPPVFISSSAVAHPHPELRGSQIHPCT